MYRYFKYTLAVLCLLLISALPVWAQSGAQTLLDKLRQTPNKKDTNYIRLLNDITVKYTFDKPDSAVIYGQQALTLAKQIKDERGEGTAYNNIAKAYYILGNYYLSLIASDKAMVVNQKTGYKSGIAGAYNNKGLIYLAQDRMADAIPEFSKALKFNEQIKDSARIAANYFNIGLSYDEIKVYDKAFIYLKKALEVAQSVKEWHIKLMALNRIGEVYFHTKDHKSALKYFTLARNFKLYQDSWEKGFTYGGLAESYYALGRYSEAITNAQKSLTIARNMKANWDAERAANILSKSYAAAGDYKNAYDYQALEKAYSDSLFNEAKDKEVNYLHLQEKKAENAKLIKQNELASHANDLNRMVILLVSLLAVFLIVVVMLLEKSRKHKSQLNKELNDLNKAIALQKEAISAQSEVLLDLNHTKDQVFSVLGHDLRSPFASILQALELIHYGDLTAEEQDLVFQDFHRQVTQVTAMINNLLTWANSQQDGISTNFEKVNLTNTVDEIVSVYNYFAKSKDQQLSHSCNNEVLIEADLNHVRIIIQNILGNAIKFTPQSGTVNIFYTQTENSVALHIKDNDVGMSADKMERLFKVSGKAITEHGTNQETGTGLGLMLIKQFTQENGGHMEIKSMLNKGSEFIIYFKPFGRHASQPAQNIRA